MRKTTRKTLTLCLVAALAVGAVFHVAFATTSNHAEALRRIGQHVDGVGVCLQAKLAAEPGYVVTRAKAARWHSAVAAALLLLNNQRVTQTQFADAVQRIQEAWNDWKATDNLPCAYDPFDVFLPPFGDPGDIISPPGGGSNEW